MLLRRVGRPRTGVQPSWAFQTECSTVPGVCRSRPFYSVCRNCVVQDPAYPVYVDSSVIMGMTGDYNPGSTKFDGIQYMPCSPDNDFFPDLSKVRTSSNYNSVVNRHVAPCSCQLIQ